MSISCYHLNAWQPPGQPCLKGPHRLSSALKVSDVLLLLAAVAAAAAGVVALVIIADTQPVNGDGGATAAYHSTLHLPECMPQCDENRSFMGAKSTLLLNGQVQAMATIIDH